MKQIPFEYVTLDGGFWGEKEALNRDVTINAVYDRFAETGRTGVFACRYREGSTDVPKPHIFWDSDIAKWIEGASNILMKTSRPDLEEKIEAIIDDMEANQWTDGYLNGTFTVINPTERFTLRSHHELYCLGHLIEAAIAYDKATGRDRFLKLIQKYVALVDRLFRVEGNTAFLTPGHEEIELALLKLWRHTGNESYKTLAGFFLETRGNNEKDRPVSKDFGTPYSQDDAPIRQLTEARGHAVRACYLYSAMADLAAANGDEALMDACRSLYRDITEKKMYITGGIGSTSLGEAFTVPFDLPPETAYTETCASIALAFFSQRMLNAEADAAYADTVERALYNGILSGLSLSGDAFFYENPLSVTKYLRTRHTSTTVRDRLPITERVRVFSCSCCPPNLNRLLSSLGDYAYGVDGDCVYVHQYMNGSMKFEGKTVTVKTAYPCSGHIEIETDGIRTLALRIPAWCRSVRLNRPHKMVRGYAMIDVSEIPTVVLDLTLEATAVYGNPAIASTAGKVAVQYGPIVYCYEGIDNGGTEPWKITLDLPLAGKVDLSDILHLPVLRLSGHKALPAPTLYSPIPASREPVEVRLIPYFAFANRGTDDMAVWLNT